MYVCGLLIHWVSKMDALMAVYLCIGWACINDGPSSPTSICSKKSLSLPSTVSHRSISATLKSKQLMTPSSSMSKTGAIAENRRRVVGLHATPHDTWEGMETMHEARFQAERNPHSITMVEHLPDHTVPSGVQKRYDRLWKCENICIHAHPYYTLYLLK